MTVRAFILAGTLVALIGLTSSADSSVPALPHESLPTSAAAPAGSVAPAEAAPVIRFMTVLVNYHVPEALLFGLSIMVLTLALERFYVLGLAREDTYSSRLIRQMDETARQKRFTSEARTALLDLCRQCPGALSRVVSQVIARAGCPLADVESASWHMLEIEQRNLGGPTGHLSLVARTAPFVGLFGTVAGVMVAFAGASQRAAGREALLSQGVSTALVTTAAGIAVAVLAIVTAHFARHRQHRLFDRMRTALLTLHPVVAASPVGH